jgi:5S rRNA maturation endonuclease (ribonuclease M5)
VQPLWYNYYRNKERELIKMNISQVIEVIELLELEYKIDEFEKNLSRLKVILDYDNSGDEIAKAIYFNPKTGLVIPKYEEKMRIKEQIKKLKEELEVLEEK